MLDNLTLFLISDINLKEEFDFFGHVPDFSFPVAACKITQCSTFAVVCRLKSRRHVVTSQESELVWPEFPLAKVTFPQNAVPQEESLEVTAKVGMSRVDNPFICNLYLNQTNQTIHLILYSFSVFCSCKRFHKDRLDKNKFYQDRSCE